MDSSGTLYTIGHSNREIDVFTGMLREASIATLVDVRRFPGSKRWPQFMGEALAASLEDAGIGYVHVGALGGRRKARPDSPNTAWRVEGFRAYADHLASGEYINARHALMDRALVEPTAVMCAEALWWQCHRRLISDDFTARGWEVRHLMAPGKVQPHVLNVEAVMVDDVLEYPAPQMDIFPGET